MIKKRIIILILIVSCFTLLFLSAFAVVGTMLALRFSITIKTVLAAFGIILLPVVMADIIGGGIYMASNRLLTRSKPTPHQLEWTFADNTDETYGEFMYLY